MKPTNPVAKTAQDDTLFEEANALAVRRSELVSRVLYQQARTAAEYQASSGDSTDLISNAEALDQ
jgi:hypothetical protein